MKISLINAPWSLTEIPKLKLSGEPTLAPWQSMHYCYRSIHVTTWVLLSMVKSRCHCYRQQQKYPLYRHSVNGDIFINKCNVYHSKKYSLYRHSMHATSRRNVYHCYSIMHHLHNTKTYNVLLMV